MMLSQLPSHITNWPLTIGVGIAIIAGVTGVVKWMQWLDDRFVSRREFERIITDNARQEKLLEAIENLTRAVLQQARR